MEVQFYFNYKCKAQSSKRFRENDNFIALKWQLLAKSAGE